MQDVRADPLRLTICPGCGYSLVGLPDEGVCPECGRAYDQSTVVLHGWARGVRATAVNAPPGLAVGLVVMQSFGMLNLFFNPRSPPGLLGCMLLLWLGLIGYIVWQRRSRPDLPGRIQVHLNDSGCRQIDYQAQEGAPPTPWRRISEWELSELKPGRYRLRLWCATGWWKLRTGAEEPVDAEVECTSEVAAAVRERVRGWVGRGMR